MKDDDVLAGGPRNLNVNFSPERILGEGRVIVWNTNVDSHAAFSNRRKGVSDSIHRNLQITCLKVIPHQLLSEKTIEVERLNSLLNALIVGRHELVTTSRREAEGADYLGLTGLNFFFNPA